MKKETGIFLLLLLLLTAGCESVWIESNSAPNTSDNPYISPYKYYAPVKVDIMPLTEITHAKNAQDRANLKAYVSLLDSFGSQVKTPGVFRFELYERVSRSAEPKGRRITVWEDIDLSDAVENNNHWRDFLRAYEFTLEFSLPDNKSYVLQVTFSSPAGKRLSSEIVL